METITKHRAAKLAIAIIGGIITVYLGPWSVIFMASGISNIAEPFAFAYLARGLGALTGIIAFWVWVFSRTPWTEDWGQVLKNKFLMVP